MKKTTLLAISLILLLIASCGPSVKPIDLASKIGKVYNEAITGIAGLTKGHPEAEKIIDKVKALKEQIIQKMVKLGKVRETLSDSDKKNVSYKIMTVNSKLQKTKQFQDSWDIMTKALNYYNDEKKYELASLISSFNIIQQYSQFELLKKQAPKEVKRLKLNIK